MKDCRPELRVLVLVADMVVSSLAAPQSRLARTSTPSSGTASKSPPGSSASLVLLESRDADLLCVGSWPRSTSRKAKTIPTESTII